MSLSLYKAVLPANNQLATPVSMQKPPGLAKFKLRLKAYYLILSIGVETAEAICKKEYKKFDALVKNFGCQITALEVFYLITENNQLKNEAATISSLLREKQDVVQQKQEAELTTKEQVSCLNSLDIQVSRELAKLVRFRLLSIINDNKAGKEDPKTEIPYTNLEKISYIVNNVKEIGLSNLISEIQIEESKAAIAFIQNVGLIDTAPDRAEVIRLMLQATFKSKEGIYSVPLVYNTEAVLRGFKGTLLIKNKLSFCGKPLKDRLPIKVFLDMPAGTIVKKKAIRENMLLNTIIVIEGYIKSKTLLKEGLQKNGLINIVNANGATLSQYAGDKFKKVENSQSIQEIEDFAKLEKEYRIKEEILNIDHFYAASLNEEIGEKQ